MGVFGSKGFWCFKRKFSMRIFPILGYLPAYVLVPKIHWEISVTCSGNSILLGQETTHKLLVPCAKVFFLLWGGRVGALGWRVWIGLGALLEDVEKWHLEILSWKGGDMYRIRSSQKRTNIPQIWSSVTILSYKIIQIHRPGSSKCVTFIYLCIRTHITCMYIYMYVCI